MAESDIQTRFSSNKPLEADLLSEIESILRLHDLSVDDLFFKWESYCIKMDLDAQAALSLTSIRHLKQNIQDELEKTHRATQVRSERKMVNATPKASSTGDVFGMLDGLVPSTPATARLNRSAGGSTLKKKMNGLKVESSPAGMREQLKAMNGLP
jgi:DNA polymerase alpha subunit B